MTEILRTCVKCDATFSEDCCSNCVQTVSTQRIDGKYILSEISSVLNFDKGILFTFRELLIRPGINIKKFINGERKRLVKPIIYILLCSLIYTILQRILQFEEGYINIRSEESEEIPKLFIWVIKNYGYSNIIAAVCIAGWLKLFFRKHPYNFYETLILLLYVIGTAMLIFAFFGSLSTIKYLSFLGNGITLGMVYIGWALGTFYKRKSFASIFKAFIAYLLGFFFFVVLIAIIGFIPMWITG